MTRGLLPGWLLVSVAVAGCRPPAPARRAPAQTPTAPSPAAGIEVSGFWRTWDRPLSECLARHRARHAGRCRGRMALTVEKARRRMTLTCDGEPVKGYFVALGHNPVGAKQRRNDGRTPEGDYYLWGRNARSRFHLALGIAYPNAKDAERGLQQGLIDRGTCRRIAGAVGSRRKPPQDTRLGGDILIHGGGIGRVVQQGAKRYVQVQDWTAGCIALRDQDVPELFRTLPDGTPVHIAP